MTETGIYEVISPILVLISEVRNIAPKCFALLHCLWSSYVVPDLLKVALGMLNMVLFWKKSYSQYHCEKVEKCLTLMCDSFFKFVTEYFEFNGIISENSRLEWCHSWIWEVLCHVVGWTCRWYLRITGTRPCSTYAWETFITVTEKVMTGRFYCRLDIIRVVHGLNG